MSRIAAPLKDWAQIVKRDVHAIYVANRDLHAKLANRDVPANLARHHVRWYANCPRDRGRLDSRIRDRGSFNCARVPVFCRQNFKLRHYPFNPCPKAGPDYLPRECDADRAGGRWRFLMTADPAGPVWEVVAFALCVGWGRIRDSLIICASALGRLACARGSFPKAPAATRHAIA